MVESLGIYWDVTKSSGNSQLSVVFPWYEFIVVRKIHQYGNTARKQLIPNSNGYLNVIKETFLKVGNFFWKRSFNRTDSVRFV